MDVNKFIAQTPACVSAVESMRSVKIGRWLYSFKGVGTVIGGLAAIETLLVASFSSPFNWLLWGFVLSVSAPTYLILLSSELLTVWLEIWCQTQLHKRFGVNFVLDDFAVKPTSMLEMLDKLQGLPNGDVLRNQVVALHANAPLPAWWWNSLDALITQDYAAWDEQKAQKALAVFSPSVPVEQSQPTQTAPFASHLKL